MSDVQSAKQIVLDFHASLDSAADADLVGVHKQFVTDDYSWRGLHPFGLLDSVDEVVDQFWRPLRTSLGPLQRRPDVFLAGHNVVDQGETLWVCEMGHLLGLFDSPWLDIPSTNRMAFFRYAQFHRIDGGRIAESALFFDLISMMRQGGVYPLPPQTGASHVYPGPMTHDGLLHDAQPVEDGEATMDLVHRMVEDLSEANRIAEATGSDRVPREVLAKTWHEDMIWSGPDGIGATYTIDRYQQQHQYPFRFNLSGKTFNGHVARFAEGNYACFFGWPNLTNQPTGGFLGMPSSRASDMYVTDVYRRDGGKLAENWVLIDLPRWLKQQGLDVLQRMRQLQGEQL